MEGQSHLPDATGHPMVKLPSNGTQDETSSSKPIDPAVYAAMMEELGICRLDDLKLEDRKREQANIPRAAPKPKKLPPKNHSTKIVAWQNYKPDDVDEADALLNTLENGQAHRQRMEAGLAISKQSGRGGFGSGSRGGRADGISRGGSHAVQSMKNFDQKLPAAQVKSLLRNPTATASRGDFSKQPASRGGLKQQQASRGDFSQQSGKAVPSRSSTPSITATPKHKPPQSKLLLSLATPESFFGSKTITQPPSTTGATNPPAQSHSSIAEKKKKTPKPTPPVQKALPTTKVRVTQPPLTTGATDAPAPSHTSAVENSIAQPPPTSANNSPATSHTGAVQRPQSSLSSIHPVQYEHLSAKVQFSDCSEDNSLEQFDGNLTILSNQDGIFRLKIVHTHGQLFVFVSFEDIASYSIETMVKEDSEFNYLAICLSNSTSSDVSPMNFKFRTLDTQSLDEMMGIMKQSISVRTNSTNFIYKVPKAQASVDQLITFDDANDPVGSERSLSVVDSIYMNDMWSLKEDEKQAVNEVVETTPELAEDSRVTQKVDEEKQNDGRIESLAELIAKGIVPKNRGLDFSKYAPEREAAHNDQEEQEQHESVNETATAAQKAEDGPAKPMRYDHSTLANIRKNAAPIDITLIPKEVRLTDTPKPSTETAGPARVPEKKSVILNLRTNGRGLADSKYAPRPVDSVAPSASADATTREGNRAKPSRLHHRAGSLAESEDSTGSRSSESRPKIDKEVTNRVVCHQLNLETSKGCAHQAEQATTEPSKNEGTSSEQPAENIANIPHLAQNASTENRPPSIESSLSASDGLNKSQLEADCGVNASASNADENVAPAKQTDNIDEPALRSSVEDAAGSGSPQSATNVVDASKFANNGDSEDYKRSPPSQFSSNASPGVSPGKQGNMLVQSPTTHHRVSPTIPKTTKGLNDSRYASKDDGEKIAAQKQPGNSAAQHIPSLPAPAQPQPKKDGGLSTSRYASNDEAEKTAPAAQPSSSAAQRTPSLPAHAQPQPKEIGGLNTSRYASNNEAEKTATVKQLSSDFAQSTQSLPAPAQPQPKKGLSTSRYASNDESEKTIPAKQNSSTAAQHTPNLPAPAQLKKGGSLSTSRFASNDGDENVASAKQSSNSATQRAPSLPTSAQLKETRGLNSSRYGNDENDESGFAAYKDQFSSSAKQSMPGSSKKLDARSAPFRSSSNAPDTSSNSFSSPKSPTIRSPTVREITPTYSSQATAPSLLTTFPGTVAPRTLWAKVAVPNPQRMGSIKTLEAVLISVPHMDHSAPGTVIALVTYTDPSNPSRMVQTEATLMSPPRDLNDKYYFTLLFPDWSPPAPPSMPAVVPYNPTISIQNGSFTEQRSFPAITQSMAAPIYSAPPASDNSQATNAWHDKWQRRDGKGT